VVGAPTPSLRVPPDQSEVREWTLPTRSVTPDRGSDRSRPGGGSERGVWCRSPWSVTGFLLGSVCLGLVVSMHVVYLGLIPIAISVGAVKRREPIAVSALVLATLLLFAGVVLSAVS
jgi:hypothetical protein